MVKVNNVIDSSKDVFTSGLDEEDFDSGFSGMFKSLILEPSTIQFSVLSDSKENQKKEDLVYISSHRASMRLIIRKILGGRPIKVITTSLPRKTI